MSDRLREYDNSIGRCVHCSKLVFKDEDWVMPHYFTSMLMTKPAVAHRDCEQESMRRASQIGISL